MHGAPSVQYPVGRSAWAAVLLLMIWLAGVAALAFWWAEARVRLWEGIVAAAAVVLSGAAGIAHWNRTGERLLLSWGGATWTLCEPLAEREGDLEVALDLQSLMFLRWRPRTGGEARWLWAERKANPSGWDDLRRAVYSRASPDAAPGAQPPAAHS